MAREIALGMTIRGCDRCGGDHKDLRFKALSRSSGSFTHWCPCPANQEPIMLGIAHQSSEGAPEHDMRRLADHINGTDLLQFVGQHDAICSLFGHEEGQLVDRMAKAVDLLDWIRGKAQVQAMAMGAMMLDPDHPLIPADALLLKLEEVLPTAREKEQKKPDPTNMFARGLR